MAFELLELNTELHPKASYTYIMRARLQAGSGQRDDAIAVVEGGHFVVRERHPLVATALARAPDAPDPGLDAFIVAGVCTVMNHVLEEVVDAEERAWVATLARDARARFTG